MNHILRHRENKPKKNPNNSKNPRVFGSVINSLKKNSNFLVRNSKKQQNECNTFSVRISDKYGLLYPAFLLNKSNWHRSDSFSYEKKINLKKREG